MARTGARLCRWSRPRLSDGGAANGGIHPRARSGGDSRLDGCDDGERSSTRSLPPGRRASRQTFHGRRWGQGFSRAGAARRLPRRVRADDEWARPRPHRWDARQARVHSRNTHRPHDATGCGSARAHRLRAHWPDRGDRSSRSQAIRTAECDRHRRGDSSHRLQHHEQEARGGPDRPRARREAGIGIVHPRPRAGARSRADDDRARCRSRLSRRRARHSHGPPAGSRLWKRPRGRGGDTRAPRGGAS